MSATPSPVDDSTLAHAIRFLAIDAIIQATEGHQGVPLGMAEIATALYTRHLKFNPADPTWPDRDRVVLSNGHGSMLLWALLYLTGYELISLDQIKRFRELGSHCEGHPEIDARKGVEVTTGPLGQGIANALGMAVAEAFLQAQFGAGVVDHHTYAFVGDGCLQEGIGQEMISLAGHLRLGKLVLLWDDNQITDDGSTSLSISEDVAERCRVAGWHVVEVDGHDIEAVSAAIAQAKADPRPSFIACRTVIARGLARLQGQRGGHSAPLFAQDAADARQALNWPHPAFEVPAPVLQAWRQAGRRSQAEHAAWTARHQAMPTALRQAFDRVQAGQLPDGWREVLRGFKREAFASREAIGGILLSARIQELLTDMLPERMVGCADLEAPTSHKRGLHAFTADDRSGAYVHCGVREHLMGAMANGMAAHGGVMPLAVTYLAFSDYERAAMRMAALMNLPVKFVFSHDSIGVGKNGPTHQPVEILASLRAMPNMLVMRPADAAEAAECWELALAHRSGPVTLAFARQALPGVRLQHTDDNLSARGAYVLSPEVLSPACAQAGPVVLLATGSEVAIAVAAQALLQQAGIAARVVSMPCWALFDAQDAAYRAQVLGPAGTVRVGVEAAVRFGWDRYLGDRGGFVGMSSFGASGPAPALYDKFGITAQAVADLARQLVAEAASVGLHLPGRAGVSAAQWRRLAALRRLLPKSRRPPMFSHVMIGTNNLERAKAFYDAVLGTLGVAPGAVDRHRIFWRTPTGVFSVSLPINGEPATVGNGSTFGFACTSPEQADAWHAAGLAHGGSTCEDPPGVREGAAGKLYLAYLRDPDGNKICGLYRMPKA